MTSPQKGTLYLVPTPLDFGCDTTAPIADVLPQETLRVASHLSHWITENAKSTRAFLKGEDIGLVSEAGMPAVADPGSSVVLAAHQLGIRVVPLVGPVSLLLALAASGLNGQNFAFVGYLPQDGAARLQRIREIEALSLKTGQTQLFIETPYRNKALWEALLKGLQSHTRLARASGLSLPSMDVQCRAVKDWRQTSGIGDAPTVFAIGR